MNTSQIIEILTLIVAIVGALSWIPILIDKLKRRKVSATLIHCRFFNGFSFPVLPPDYVAKLLNGKEKNDIQKYEGALIVIGLNILSVNRDFIIKEVITEVVMDKSSHQTIPVSPDVIVPFVGSLDDTLQARLLIPSELDVLKVRNIPADKNTRLYMAVLCKDLYDLNYKNLIHIKITFEDARGAKFQTLIDKNSIERASLIKDYNVYDVHYLARNNYRKAYENLPSMQSTMPPLPDTQRTDAS